MREVRVGDLLLLRRLCSNRRRVLGLLLEDPMFPAYGSFPRRFKVLRDSGVVEVYCEERKMIVEVLRDV